MNALHLDEEKNAVLGDLDSLNALIGLAKSFVRRKKVVNLLTELQHDIFLIQANVAEPANATSEMPIALGRVLWLQKETYDVERRLPSINHFIVPEGTPGACLLHCVRTTARQIERKIPGYLKKPTRLAMFLDRVAGLMFALARDINRQQHIHEQPPAYMQTKPKGENHESRKRKSSRKNTRANQISGGQARRRAQDRRRKSTSNAGKARSR